MGHTILPFTRQFKIELARFSQFKRGLLIAEDKLLFSDLWNRAEFHVPAAEITSHPLPIATILMMINLEQEKSIHKMQADLGIKDAQIKNLKSKLARKDLQISNLSEQILELEESIEERLNNFREEMLAIKYEYAP